MPKSKEYLSTSDSDSDAEPRPKKKKAEKKPEKKEKQGESSKTGDPASFQLSNMRFVSVSQFKGKKYVNIREFYNDANGDLKPGKKGIALNVDQWEKLKGFVEDVDEALETL